MDPREKHYPPQSTADIASATLESGLTVTQSSVCSYLSSPLMDFEGLSSGESSILPGLSSSSSSASPSTEIEECSATNHIVPMETESKGSFSSSPRLGTEVGGAGVRPTSVTGGARKREFIGIPQPLECRQGNPVPPFLSKTYALVEDKSLDPIISWGSSGESFVVWDVVEFARAVLPQNFKHNNFSSFVRQLNTYGFHKIDTDHWEFANEKFVWGKRHLLKNIRRRKSSQSEQIESYSESSVEEGKSGLESEIGGLRDEKNLMMQEVVNLQQEHRGTAEQLEAMKQRLQTAEQRQKQMVSFVAKLLQNPVFLTRFQQKGEHKEVTSSRVRRKFIKQQQHPDQVKQESSMGGRIVKYRPDWNSIPTSLGTQESGPVERQLSDHILEGMVGKHSFGSSGMQVQIGNIASTEMQQELIGSSDQMGLGVLDPEPITVLDPKPMASDEAFIEGKNVVSPQSGVSPEYYVSLPEDLAREKTFPDYMFLGAESMLKLEDMWNMGFNASDGASSSSHDVWDNLVNYDVQELGVPGGLSYLWDMSSQQTGGVSGIDKWLGDESALDDFEKQDEQLKDDPLMSTGS